MPTTPHNQQSITATAYGTDEWLTLTGQQPESQLVHFTGSTLLHPDIIIPLMALQTAAMQQGYTLAIASGFRSFVRQQLIWNSKADGTRTILDEQGCPIDKTLLSDKELLFAILRWSAIPGCSRHHWGTDIDVYDAASVSSDYTLQLTSAECTATGPFTAMHNWLDDVLPSSQFFRPYTLDIGGIAPERWHLSYMPAAAPYEQLLDETRLIDWIMSQDIALKNLIRTHWHDIFHRYVKVSHSG